MLVLLTGHEGMLLYFGSFGTDVSSSFRVFQILICLVLLAIMSGRKRMQAGKSVAQLDAFAVGIIAALNFEGYSIRQIADSDILTKPDGEPVSFSRVGEVVRHLDRDPFWRGDRQEGSGRERATTAQEDKKIVKEVLARRGKEKMTSNKARRRSGVGISARTVRRRLNEAGLRWLRRRRKWQVPDSALEPRLEWASRVLHSSDSFLKRWVYTDGVAFYLDKTPAEAQSKKRAALGHSVWRHTEQKDALYKDCIGPSSYSKAQGERVRVWGLLVDGHLYITVLGKGGLMNRHVYAQVVRTSFKKWLRGRRNSLVVQDGEKALWCEEPMEAFRELNLEVLTWHPPHSPDLNAIEYAWKLLRDRLADTQPSSMEDRPSFVRRLYSACDYVNRHHTATLRNLCLNQKERAKDVKDATGHRTKW